jgi:hypothetical protein
MTQPRLSLIMGTGRSGSTWLGSIVDTHPEVAYRFEPLARLRDDREIAALRKQLTAERVDETLLERLHQRLLRADPLTSKPPFFPKASGRTLGRARLWPLARVFAPARGLFRAAYAALPGAALVLKEVGLNRLVLPLVRAGVPTLHLVRHPCGFVASVLKGQAANLMPTGRRGVIRDLLRKHDPKLAERWDSRLDEATPARAEALLWRIEVEEAMRACEARENVRVVVYEALCRDPAAAAESAFAHFGLPRSERALALLEEMSAPNARARNARGERWLDDYFSVFRDSQESAHKWKRDLPASTIRDVLEAVADSDAFVRCAALGGWD